MKDRALNFINFLNVFHRVEQDKSSSGAESLVRQMDVVDRVMAEPLGEGFSRNSLKVIMHRRFNRALSEGLIEQVEVNHFKLTEEGKMRRLSRPPVLRTNYRNNFGENAVRGVQYSFGYNPELYQGVPDFTDEMRALINEFSEKVALLNGNKNLEFRLSLEIEGPDE